MNRYRLVWLLGILMVALLVGIVVAIWRNSGFAGIPRERIEVGYVLPPEAAVDEFLRLKRWPGKRQIPCPKMDEGTVVVLILGQSNAGNHGGQRFKSKYNRNVINFDSGTCTVAESPLLGATGQGGEPWTIVGDLLIEIGKATNVILVPVAVSGSRIANWTPNGRLSGVLSRTLEGLRQFYNPTHVVWLQGESDFAMRTPPSEYRALLRTLVKSLRSADVSAPVYVAVASKCAGKPEWRVTNNVADAQRASADMELGIFSGPDLDASLSTEDRYDGCHLTGSGLLKVAHAWVSVIVGRRVQTPALDQSGLNER